MVQQSKLKEWAHRTEESYSPETVEVMARVRAKFMEDSFAGDYESIDMQDPDVQDLANRVKVEKFQTLISRDELRETLVNRISSARKVTDLEQAETPAELTKFRLNQLSDYRESLGDDPIVDSMPDYSAKRADIERFVDDTIMDTMLNDQVTHGSQMFATKESADLLLGDGPIDVMYELQMDNQSDLAVFATVSENYPADEQVVFDRMQAGRLVYHHNQQGYRNIDYALESYDNALIASQQSSVELPPLDDLDDKGPQLPPLDDLDDKGPQLPPLDDLDDKGPQLPPLSDDDVVKQNKSYIINDVNTDEFRKIITLLDYEMKISDTLETINLPSLEGESVLIDTALNSGLNEYRFIKGRVNDKGFIESDECEYVNVGTDVSKVANNIIKDNSSKVINSILTEPQKNKIVELTDDDLIDLKTEEPGLELTDDDLPDWDIDDLGLKQ